MTKEKLVSLKRYLDHLTNRLSSPTPEKHQSHPQTYKAFLENEIRLVSSQLEKAKQ